MNIFRQAIEHYGEQHQRVKAIEELSELIQALTKDLDGKEHNVPEEIADVYIMLEQMELIYGVEEVHKFYHNKINRLSDRIKGETYPY